MTALTLREPPLPQCSRAARVAPDGTYALALRRVDRDARSFATTVRDASFLRSGALVLERRRNCEGEE